LAREFWRLPCWSAIAAAGIAVALLANGAIGAAALQRSQSSAASTPIFRDVARQAGLDFIHVNGASDEKFLPEIIGSGGLFFDFDNDGWLDVFLVDSPADRLRACAV
jgi:hypothetical protein